MRITTEKLEDNPDYNKPRMYCWHSKESDEVVIFEEIPKALLDRVYALDPKLEFTELLEYLLGIHDDLLDEYGAW